MDYNFGGEQIQVKCRGLESALEYSGVNNEDHAKAQAVHADLAFGQIQHEGVETLLQDLAMGPKTRVIYDLGAGRGLVTMQAMLRNPQLKHSVGIELTQVRGLQCMYGLQLLSESAEFLKWLNTMKATVKLEFFTVICLSPQKYAEVSQDQRISKLDWNDHSKANLNHLKTVLGGLLTIKHQGGHESYIEMRLGDLFDAVEAPAVADIVICETV